MSMLVCSVLIISGLDSQSKFQMFTLFSGRHINWCTTEVYQHSVFILGSVNLCGTFQRISDVCGIVQT